MRLLLDTHYLIWLVGRPELLSSEEQALLAGDVALLASPLSVWEVRLKWQTRRGDGQRKLDVSPRQIIEAADFLGCDWLAVDAAVLGTPLDHPLPHRDPFDEMLLVQAQQAEAKLLSRDALLVGHPVVLTL